MAVTSKHDTLTQCCFKVGPMSDTLGQRWTSIGWVYFSPWHQTLPVTSQVCLIATHVEPIMARCWPSVTDGSPTSISIALRVVLAGRDLQARFHSGMTNSSNCLLTKWAVTAVWLCQLYAYGQQHNPVIDRPDICENCKRKWFVRMTAGMTANVRFANGHDILAVTVHVSLACVP